MEKKTSNIRQSSMFLIELIIAVLFLSLCSAICIRLFVTARITEKESYELTQSVTAAQNIGAVFEAGVEEQFRPVLPTASTKLLSAVDYMASSFDGSEILFISGKLDSYQDQPVLTIYYDDNFSTCSSESASYIAYVFVDYNDFVVSADIFIKKSDASSDFHSNDEIYKIHVDHAISNVNHTLSDSTTYKGGILS